MYDMKLQIREGGKDYDFVRLSLLFLDGCIGCRTLSFCLRLVCCCILTVSILGIGHLGIDLVKMELSEWFKS